MAISMELDGETSEENVRFVMEKTVETFFSGTFVQQILTSKDGRPMLQALPNFLPFRGFCEVGFCRKKDEMIRKKGCFEMKAMQMA